MVTDMIAKGDAPFFNGIVCIGEFDGDMDERQSDDFSVTIEWAE